MSRSTVTAMIAPDPKRGLAVVQLELSTSAGRSQ